MRKFFLILPLILSGCFATYPHKVFKQNTGMEFGKEVNLCPGGSVQSSKTCEPAGEGWKKGKKVTGAQLEAGDKVFERINNNYLLQEISGYSRIIIHSYNLWASELNDPASNIELEEKVINESFKVDFIPETYVTVEISEIYEKTAIKEATAAIKTEAKAKNIQFSAEFYASVENKLKQEIRSLKNTELTYHYITAQYIGKLSKGEDDIEIKSISELSPVIENYEKNKKIITGVSGFLFTNFKANQTVFDEILLETAIQASANLANNQQIEYLAEIKVSASVKWSQKVNEKINTALRTRGTGVFFYPLWYKSVSK